MKTRLGVGDKHVFHIKENLFDNWLAKIDIVPCLSQCSAPYNSSLNYWFFILQAIFKHCSSSWAMRAQRWGRESIHGSSQLDVWESTFALPVLHEDNYQNFGSGSVKFKVLTVIVLTYQCNRYLLCGDLSAFHLRRTSMGFKFDVWL